MAEETGTETELEREEREKRLDVPGWSIKDPVRRQEFREKWATAIPLEEAYRRYKARIDAAG